MAKAGGNRAPTLSPDERNYYKQIENNEGFPWTLVHDGDEFEKFWLSVVLPNVDPPIVVPIDPEFQICEPSWVGFTFHGTFYALGTLFF